MTHAVELKNITKRFGHVVANDKVDLYVDNGVIMSLLGENGSGKTTLMNMLAGIYYPDEGQIFVNGKEVSIRSPKDAYENGIGMIHQHFKLIDVFTAAQNVALGIEDGKYDLKKVAAGVKEISDKYGFGIDPNKKIYEMSVSEKQTVEIIKVLYRGANILILDEPTNDLDPRSQTWLLKLLKDLRNQGKTLIFATHNLELVPHVADRAILFAEDHTLRADKPVRELLEDTALLREVNLVDEHFHTHPWDFE